jgi:hypothetical protein
MSSFHEESHNLAAEFDVAPDVMDAFVNRFSPRRTADNQFLADSDVMLFVHIPKTAGMSVGKTLRGAFHKFHPINWKEVNPSFRHAMRLALYLQTQEKKRQIIMGHFGWAELQIWKSHELPLKCGTVFREPVARTVSNYNYNCSDLHPDNTAFKARYPTLLDYAQAVPFDMQLSLAIGLIDSFETALRKLTLHYSFLGLTEHLGQSLFHLQRTHGLRKLTEHQENKGAGRSGSDLPKDVRTLIESRSCNDRKMHRLMARLYGAA